MHPLLKPLYRLVIPLFLLLAAGYSLNKIETLDSNYLHLLELLPYLLFLLALGIAHFYNRARFFCASLAMLASYWLIHSQLQTPLTEIKTFYFYTALSLALPTAMLLFSILPEKGLWNSNSLLPLAITPALAITIYFYRDSIDTQHLSQLTQFFPVRPSQHYVLSLNGSLWFLLTAIILLSLLLRRNTEAEAALISSQLFAFTTLAFFDQPHISSILFSAAAIALIIGLLRSSFEMAYRDELTGLLGRRALNEKLLALGRSYTIAMLDVDHFKKFNDTHGHDVGDDVLKIVARHINRVAGGGTPYRYGGEEFCIIFPGKTLKSCTPHLETVRLAIRDYPIALRDKSNRPLSSKEGTAKRRSKPRAKTVSVTISIGVAERTPDINDPQQVLKTADDALYRAKQQGRNCLAS